MNPWRLKQAVSKEAREQRRQRRRDNMAAVISECLQIGRQSLSQESTRILMRVQHLPPYVFESFADIFYGCYLPVQIIDRSKVFEFESNKVTNLWV